MKLMMKLCPTKFQKSNNVASASPPLACVAQCRPNQAIAFADTTTLTTTTSSFPTANNDYLLGYSSSPFLQGHRLNGFLEVCKTWWNHFFIGLIFHITNFVLCFLCIKIEHVSKKFIIIYFSKPIENNWTTVWKY